MKYHIPAGTSIERYRSGHHWEIFVTTKDAYYTDADVVQLQNSKMFMFMLPKTAKPWLYIYVATELIHIS